MPAEDSSALDPRYSLVPVPSSLLSTGFSLIEILVVTVILAVVAATVTLAIAGAGGERQLARDAERIGALVNYACEQAELSGRDIGISINPTRSMQLGRGATTSLPLAPARARAWRTSSRS